MNSYEYKAKRPASIKQDENRMAYLLASYQPT